jgi:hypothetical protein
MVCAASTTTPAGRPLTHPPTHLALQLLHSLNEADDLFVLRGAAQAQHVRHLRVALLGLRVCGGGGGGVGGGTILLVELQMIAYTQ